MNERAHTVDELLDRLGRRARDVHRDLKKKTNDVVTALPAGCRVVK